MAENTAAGQPVGAALTATDVDTTTLTYTLEGTDAAAFTIIGTSGQLRTRAGVTYDYEAQDSYAVMVRADDGNGGTATIVVTITLTDVNEPPLAPERPAVRPVRGSESSLQVTWAAPANTGRPAIAHYALQYRLETASTWTDAPPPTGPAARLEGLLPDRVYEVRVRAVNADGDGLWSELGRGRTVKDARAVRAWLARFGRTVTTHVTDTVGERLRAAPGQESYLTVGGYRLPLGPRASGGAEAAAAPLTSLVTGLAGMVLGSGATRPAPGATGAGSGDGPFGRGPAPGALADPAAPPVARSIDGQCLPADSGRGRCPRRPAPDGLGPGGRHAVHRPGRAPDPGRGRPHGHPGRG